jgi:hypothetical protein
MSRSQPKSYSRSNKSNRYSNSASKTRSKKSASNYKSRKSSFNPSYVSVPSSGYTRRRIQPSGHDNLYYIQNPELYEGDDEYITILSNAVKQITHIKMVNKNVSRYMLRNLYDYINDEGLCLGIGDDYRYNTLRESRGVIFLDKITLSNAKQGKFTDYLGFATIEVKNDDDDLYLEVPLICSNLAYKGMGTKLVEALVDIAKASGCKYIELESVKSAVDFYEKMGFKHIGKNVQGLTPMRYDILSDEKFKETSHYKKAYLEPGSFGGKR